jgi:uncharacterized damage-inducible protein DinB
MKYQTIAEIYSANQSIREKLRQTLLALTPEQVVFRSSRNDWTITEIVEHMAIVENGMVNIVSGLLQKATAENVENDGSANISEEFLKKTALLSNRRERKAVAPERVLPTGRPSITESLSKMDENGKLLTHIRPRLETVNTQKFKFPHPFFGDLNATEWLALIGGHELRHIDQIEEILSNQ